MAIIDSYSESSYLADQVLADLPSTKMAILEIPTLRAHIWSDQVFCRPSVPCERPFTHEGNFLIELFLRPVLISGLIPVNAGTTVFKAFMAVSVISCIFTIFAVLYASLACFY